MNQVEERRRAERSHKTQRELQREIQGFEGDPDLIVRLQEMGLREGQKVTLEGRSPFGGPILLRSGTTVLALREEEFLCVKMKT